MPRGRARSVGVVVEPLDVVDRRGQPEGAPTPRRGASRVVVSSQAIADGVGVDQAQVDAGRRARAATTSAGPRPGRATVTVSKNGRIRDLDTAVAQPRGERPRPAGAPGARSRAGRRGRGRRRTSPAMTASSTCAVQMLLRRLLAADVLLAGLQRQPVGGRAVGVDRDADQPAGQLPLRARCGRPGSRRAGRRSPAARRSAGWCRRRCRRRARRARCQQGEREQVGGDDDAARRARARPRRAARGRGPRRRRPGTARARRRRRRPAAARSRSWTTTSRPSGSRPGADDVERLRERVGVDDEDVARCGRHGAPAPSPRRRRCPRRASRRRRPAGR